MYIANKYVPVERHMYIHTYIYIYTHIHIDRKIYTYIIPSAFRSSGHGSRVPAAVGLRAEPGSVFPAWLGLGIPPKELPVTPEPLHELKRQS